MSVLILHGIGGHAGIHWQQWLSDQLQAAGQQVTMPNLADSDHPDRATWLETIRRSAADTDLAELTIVGHSLGVTAALDFIEQVKQPIKKLVSVSGFAIDYGAELNSYYLREKTIDFAKVRANLKATTVFYADDDPYVTQDALQQLANALEVEPIIIHEGGHLNSERGYITFPAVLQTITGDSEEKL